MNKIVAREKYLKIRKDIKDRDSKDSIIFDKLINNKKIKKAKIVAIYSPFNGEYDTTKLARYLLNENKTICYPRVIDEDSMEFIKVNSIDEVNTIGFYKGILEPKEDCNLVIKKEDIDVMIVPCVCFDTNNYRVGYGKGYYDKYLFNVDSIYKIGVSYLDLKIEEFLEVDSFDVKLDTIVTE